MLPILPLFEIPPSTHSENRRARHRKAEDAMILRSLVEFVVDIHGGAVDIDVHGAVIVIDIHRAVADFDDHGTARNSQ